MNKKGVTLVELIVVVAIVGIITTVIVNIFIFGNRTFYKSENKSSQQMDSRIAIQTISKELRYASKVVLLEDISLIKNSDDKEFKYIYLDQSSKKIMKKEGSNPAYEFLKGNQTFDEIYFNFTSANKANGVKKEILKLFIKSRTESNQNDSSSYDVETAISLLNQKESETDSVPEVEECETGCKVIRYKK